VKAERATSRRADVSALQSARSHVPHGILAGLGVQVPCDGPCAPRSRTSPQAARTTNDRLRAQFLAAWNATARYRWAPAAPSAGKECTTHTAVGPPIIPPSCFNMKGRRAIKGVGPLPRARLNGRPYALPAPLTPGRASSFIRFRHHPNTPTPFLASTQAPGSARCSGHHPFTRLEAAAAGATVRCHLSSSEPHRPFLWPQKGHR
jgi:hypothetical protein